MPQWQDLIVLSGEEAQIRAKLKDVYTKWFTAFLLANKNVMTESDNYVKEYKAAGADTFLTVWTKKAVAAQNKWETVVGK